MCSDINGDDTVRTFTCPICLGEISFQPTQPRTKSDNPQDQAVISDNNFDDQTTSSPAREDDNTNTSTNSITTYQNSSSIYELKSCHHNFCTVCLRAYIRSKISDCVVDIPCCHFKLSTMDDGDDDDDDDDFHLCNELIEEEDIYNLIHAKGIREDDANKTHDWCCQDTHNTTCTSIDQTRDVIEEASMKGVDIALWTKYQKLKFDKLHGKDCVRRCPKCDEATLFDENSMKLYQCTYLSLAAGEDATSANDSDGDMTRLQRMYHAFRQRKQSGEEIDSVLEDTAEVDEQVSSLNGEEDQETPNSSEQQCTLVKSTYPNVTCKTCDTHFCYFHANAHGPGKAACIEYHAKSIEDDRANVDYANNILRAKPCPNCGIPVSKESGCNQMKCSACGTHFCWLCSAIVDDGAFPEHFRWWNLKGCANLQLDENGSQGGRILAKIMSVLQIIVLGAPALALTLVTILLCPCFVPGCGRSNRERLINMVSFWGSFLSSMLFLPFTCIGLLVVTALYCFIATLLLCVKGCKRPPREGATESNNTPSGGSTRVSNAGVGDSSTGMSNEDLVRLFRMEEGELFRRMEEGALQVTEEE